MPNSYKESGISTKIKHQKLNSFFQTKKRHSNQNLTSIEID